jgi:GTP-binding protein HflX
MAGMISTMKGEETAVLVALSNKDQDMLITEEYLHELEFLAQTLGIRTVGSFTQKSEKPDIRSFVGKGKLEEIKTYVKAEKVDIVIFDDDLTPSQLRNLEKELKCKIYDRSLLILDIFLKRAKTSRARTQVELARNQYLLPRLTRLWTHLERQRGGTGTVGGAGEKEIETDRRIIRNKITLLREKLKKIDKQASTQRKSRNNIVKVSLVGYTNVGKSTIMRLLSKENVFAENKLFATVDSTVRKVVLNEVPFLLTDTVGFIRKLPHTLVESFKSTLDEVREADILVHVVDISHQQFEDQIRIVNDTLKEIDSLDKPTILVFNKMDLLKKKSDLNEDNPEFESTDKLIENLQRRYLAINGAETVFMSASTRDKLNALRSTVFHKVLEKHKTIYPHFIHYGMENGIDPFAS